MKLFYIFLFFFTFSMLYAVVNKYFYEKNLYLYYPQSNLNSNKENPDYCYERIALNSKKHKVEEMMFALIENTVLGPQNIFLKAPQDKDVSVKKIYWFDDLLVINFNLNLNKITLEEEKILLRNISLGIKKNFPQIKIVKWLIDGKAFKYLSGEHDFRINLFEDFKLKTVPAC